MLKMVVAAAAEVVQGNGRPARILTGASVQGTRVDHRDWCAVLDYRPSTLQERKRPIDLWEINTSPIYSPGSTSIEPGNASLAILVETDGELN